MESPQSLFASTLLLASARKLWQHEDEWLRSVEGPHAGSGGHRC